MKKQANKKFADFISPLIMVAVLLIIAFLSSFITDMEQANDNLYLKVSSFKGLNGWNDDNQQKSIVAFKKSCSRILKKNPDAEFGTGGFAGKAGLWQDICKKLITSNFETNKSAREFFENNFTPYEIWGKDGRNGLFTGYYEATLHGSYKKSPRYNIPIYNRPNNLIKASLGDFYDDLKGKNITGRVEGKKFIPYYNRSEIEAGAIKNKKAEIVWVDNAVDSFFLHIQGSGRIILDNGDILRVGYAAQNGHNYTAIGRELIKRKAITKENISMQSIRKWLEENPNKAAEIMNINESYVFFNKLNLKTEGPLGAQGVSLTPRRTIAIDRKKIPYGIPLWLNAEEPEGVGRIKRLMIAQDTGGAIKGSVRGDFFWGYGEQAAHKAGIMKSHGESWLLLPKKLIIPDNKIKEIWRIF